MSGELKTAESIRAYLADVVKEVVGEKVDEIQKHYQNELAKLRSDFAAERNAADAEKKGLKAARFLRAFAKAGGNLSAAIETAHKANDMTTVRAMEATDATAGGVWVPEELSKEVIELLRPASVVRRMGPRVLDMPTGSMAMTKITGGSTAGYIGEGENVGVTGQTTGRISLNWKKLACLLPISNDLLRFNSFAGDEMIRDDAVAGLAQRSDLAFISDDGTEHTPKGIYHMAPAANKFNANATVNLANVTADIAAAILRMRNANARMLKVGWLWAPTTELYLMFLRDANGNYVWKDEMVRGTFNGFPFGATTQIPYTLGTGSNESKVYLVDFADILIGEANMLEVEASSTAAYHDGTSVVSAFSKDQTVLRLIEHHDIATRHEESIVVIEATKWNAGT
jgi:HK97 family phage major capsid protein